MTSPGEGAAVGEHRGTDDAPAPRSPRARSALWPFWPVLAWGLSVWFAVTPWVILITRNPISHVSWGWLAAPLLIVPLLASCGLAPRLMLRRRGAKEVPMAAGAAMIVHWWAAALYPFFFGVPLSDDSTILADTVLGGRLPWGATLLLQMALPVAILISLVVAVIACAPPKTPGPGPTAQASNPPSEAVRRTRRRRFAAASTLPTLLVAGICAIALGIVQLTNDAAGDTPSVASSRPIEAQVVLAAGRYDAMQAELSSVRGLIATDGWRFAAAEPPIVSRLCDGGVDCYALQLSADVVDAELVDGFSLVAVRHAMVDRGWRVDYIGADALWMRRSDGSSLRVDRGTEQRGYRLWLTSPVWYGSARELNAARHPPGLDDPRSRPAARTYRFDDWPAW